MDYTLKNNNTTKITVIGAGNGGQAIAADCAIRGFKVCLYNRSLDNLQQIKDSKRIVLKGELNGVGILDIVTDKIDVAIEFADVIFIVTTANAHHILAKQISSHIKENQIIVLTPGRTGGAFEFENILYQDSKTEKVYVCETQTLMFACRKESEGVVNIIGVKDKVFFSLINKNENLRIQEKIKHIYPSLIPAENIMQTSLENIGAMFHPSIVLFNAAAIERGNMFYFYRELTDSIALFIQKVDDIRLNIGKAYGLELISAKDWVSYAYPNIIGNTLCERIRNNPAYYDIIAPTSIYTRQLLEDIPTGIIPMIEFGKLSGVNVSLLESIVEVCSNLLNIDFYKESRNLKSMGLDKMSFHDIINKYIL